ncbi:hypothetical protein BN7_5147 [Wickerhamomyces ciferrii]|uniref:ATP-dependent DNA helicase II subunit 2 n=1 Tax=Wickerhamomyces ciferrii (strain ATCC 14091 / BCRC 22168 / CBS 111 / JCM 3599 / NBRC 0793 / NRRL Y-1031 F-60-10) TaxID=1206466 RepID=K0KJX8_WICCF|nr:uncharacterized protein BN7_5147 [Wickerhamomyces ciferrii]CCH45565.1 hypothetical protein BN7_5147 [Wickerhamomyces ciferrii]
MYNSNIIKEHSNSIETPKWLIKKCVKLESYDSEPLLTITRLLLLLLMLTPQWGPNMVDVKPFFNDLKQYDVQPTLKELKDEDRSGIVRALLLTIQNMNNFVKKLKYKKNIVLVTNSRTTPELDEEYSNAIVELINGANINLVLIGVDFHDGTEIEDFKRNIKSWESLFQALPDSTLMTGKDADNVVNYPNPKIVRPVKTFSGEFRIGANLIDKDFKPHDDLSCVCFNVDGYPATKIDRPQPRKTFALNKQDEPEPISISTEYEIHLYTNDFDNENELQNADEEDLESRPFEVQPIEKENLVKGYKYGKNTVVLPPTLDEKRKYLTEPGIDIRGIVSSQKIPRCYLTSEATIILGAKQSEADTRALGAFVDALTELDSFALARYVAKKNAEVQMVVLIPVYIKKNGGLTNKRKNDDENLEDIRGLILTRLPFYEDEKIATFPSLTEVITTSGKTITENHKLLPSDEVKELMDDLVTTMNLDSTNETDFDGDKRIFNPLVADTQLPLLKPLGNHDNLVKRSTGIHRVNLALKDIAIKGAVHDGGLESYLEQDDIIPPISEQLKADTLMKYKQKKKKKMTFH